MTRESVSPEVQLTSKKNFNWRVSEPKDFSGVSVAGGDLGNEAYVWLRKIERLKTTAKLSDEESLFLVGNHLVLKAETWFNVVGIKSKSWGEFVIAFKKQYLADQEDKWWYQLQTMKQNEGDSIDDVALKMEELFELLDNKSVAFQIRSFLSAIKPGIAFEVEKDGTPDSFEDAKSKAKRIEKSLLKYELNSKGAAGTSYVEKYGEMVKSDFFNSRMNKEESVSDSGSVITSEVSSLVAKLEQLSINLVKLNENASFSRQQPVNIRPQYNNNNVQNGAPRVFTCFYCRDEGHKKYDCPKFIRDQGQGQGNPATGSNSVPIGSVSNDVANDSGKGQERQ